MTALDDSHLRFGLLLTPGWITAPVTDQLTGRPFATLSTVEAASVLEGLGLLQSIRCGVVGAVLALLAFLTQDLPMWSSDPLWFVFFVVMTWLPSYTLFVSVGWLILRRSGRHAELMSSHPRVLALVRWAPALGLLGSISASLLFS